MDEMAVSILEAGLHPKHDVDEPDYQSNFRRPGYWLEDNWHEKIEEIMTRSQPAIVDEKGELSQGSLNPALEQEAHEVAFEDFGIDFEEGKILYRARIDKDRTRVEQFDLHEIDAPLPEGQKPVELTGVENRYYILQVTKIVRSQKYELGRRSCSNSKGTPKAKTLDSKLKGP